MTEPLDPYSQELIDAIDRAIPTWAAHLVRQRIRQSGTASPPDLAERLTAMGESMRLETSARLHALLVADPADQRGTPLSIVRAAVRFPSALLAEVGVPHVRRNEFDERVMPDDVYALSPAAWSDLGQRVHDAGLAWGAWKAKSILDRRR